MTSVDDGSVPGLVLTARGSCTRGTGTPGARGGAPTSSPAYERARGPRPGLPPHRELAGRARRPHRAGSSGRRRRRSGSAARSPPTAATSWCRRRRRPARPTAAGSSPTTSRPAPRWTASRTRRASRTCRCTRACSWGGRARPRRSRSWSSASLRSPRGRRRRRPASRRAPGCGLALGARGRGRAARGARRACPGGTDPTATSSTSWPRAAGSPGGTPTSRR